MRDCDECGRELVHDFIDELTPFCWCPHCGKEVHFEDDEDNDETAVPRVERQSLISKMAGFVRDKVRR